MKSWLKVSTGDLGTVHDKITLHHTQQKAKISRDTALLKASVQLRHQSEFHLDVVRKISYEALKEAFGRHRLAHSLPADYPACTGSYTTITGIPCCHMMNRMVADGKTHTDDRFSAALVAATIFSCSGWCRPKDLIDNTMSKIVERHANLDPHQQPFFG